MFKKIIIAEDFESYHFGVLQILENFGIPKENVTCVSYCDLAFEQIKEAQHTNEPYELIITDISFEQDGKIQNIHSGIELIQKLHHHGIEIKKMVFSIENTPETIAHLAKQYNIDGFVSKGRNDVGRMKIALEKISQGETYFEKPLHTQNNIYELNSYDVVLIRCLSDGKTQTEISAWFKEKKIKPSSVSSIEKRINSLKNYLNLKSNEQIVLYAKEIGLLH